MIKFPYKLLPLALLTYSYVVSANSIEQQISATKAQIEQLQADLQELEKVEAELPKNLALKQADDLAQKIKENELKTHAEFGFVTTSGNTDTTAYSLDLKMKKGWDRHIVEFSFDGQYADDNGFQTKNKYLAELEYDYEITERFAFDYLVGYKQDKFSGYNYQSYTGPGAKYKLIKNEKHNLSLEGNVLYSQDEIQDTHYTTAGDVIDYPNPDGLVKDSSQTVKGSTKEYAAMRAKAAYEWQILESLKFTQDLSYRTEFDDFNNYFIFSKTALISKMTDMFSLGLNYKIDYVNAPPVGKAHSDKTFTANLIVDY